LLAARGLSESVTYSFMARAQAAEFGPAPPALTLNNPIAADLDQMRPTPLATLALAAARNAARAVADIALFEIGPGYAAEGQALIAAGLRAGMRRHWQQEPPCADAMAAKADLWAALAALGVPMEALSITTDTPGHYHPGQSGVVRQGPKIVLARFGALHPALIERLGLPLASCGFELFLDSVPDPKRRRRGAPDLPQLQPVSRDFAFIVPSATPAEAILRAARAANRVLIARVALFDNYEGKNVAEGFKSVALEVVFQPREYTLTEQELAAESAKVIDYVGRATGAKLR
jgi:phenylalanyl-tRNA synthetase beta chain